MMGFNDAFAIVKDALQVLGITIDETQYDGLAVKELAASNTLDKDRSGTKQTHIAITGEQMDIFPYLRVDGYFNDDNAVLKKYFLAQIPALLNKTNVTYLNDGELCEDIKFEEETYKTSVSVLRCKRTNQEDQVQLSLITYDSPEFVTFRRLLSVGDNLVILKIKEKLEYLFLGIKNKDVDENLKKLNNKFYNSEAVTLVDVNSIVNGAGSCPVNPLRQGENIIFYGVPGCGKSHTIKNEYLTNATTQQFERTVFHPDYTYSDFIGQILPSNKGGIISYPFIPGPFTRILKKAINDPNNNYYLIIEEINRGNAPAIFGEVFQLLDRENGVSEYDINNEDIAQAIYLKEEDKNDDDKIEKAREHKIKIPYNLFILATMNTADQNVFTLDTAFKRRWEMKNIISNWDDCKFADNPLCGTDISWRDFVTTINEVILSANEGYIGSEDKRLGAFFMKASELDDVNLFGEKILMYLWNDVFKYIDKSDIFTEKYKALDALIADFRLKKFDVFKVEFPHNALIGAFGGTTPEMLTRTDAEEYLNDKPANAVEIYRKIYDEVKAIIPDTTVYGISSNAYIAFTAENIKKPLFAEFKVTKRDGVLHVGIVEPTTPAYKALGTAFPIDGHRNFYFNIDMTDNSNLDDVVNAIHESYTSLYEEKVKPLDDTPTTLEEYLAPCTEVAKGIYENILTHFSSLNVAHTLSAVKSYISVKASSGQNAATLQLKKDCVKLRVYEPRDESCKTGRLLPDSYGLVINYEIIVNKDSDMTMVANAIADSCSQLTEDTEE